MRGQEGHREIVILVLGFSVGLGRIGGPQRTPWRLSGGVKLDVGGGGRIWGSDYERCFVSAYNGLAT